MARMTFGEGVSAENLQNDLKTQFLGSVVGRIDSAHITLTDKGRSKASVVGEFIGLTFDKVKTPKITKAVLFNPSLLEKLRIFFAENDVPAYINEKGEVTTTAPATETTDKVVPKTALQKEAEAIKKNYFNLKEKEKKAADARLAAIDDAIKSA
jgi:hypothetical protein